MSQNGVVLACPGLYVRSDIIVLGWQALGRHALARSLA